MVTNHPVHQSLGARKFIVSKVRMDTRSARQPPLPRAGRDHCGRSVVAAGSAERSRDDPRERRKIADRHQIGECRVGCPRRGATPFAPEIIGIAFQHRAARAHLHVDQTSVAQTVSGT